MSKYDDLRAMREARFASAPKVTAPKPKPAITRKASNGAATKPKGRPIAGLMHKTNEALKPWLALGMSRATWYRRKSQGVSSHQSQGVSHASR